MELLNLSMKFEYGTMNICMEIWVYGTTKFEYGYMSWVVWNYEYWYGI